MPRVEREWCTVMQNCRGKLGGCGEFRLGREIGCRPGLGTGRSQGRGQLHSRRWIRCKWPEGRPWGLKWVRVGSSTLSQVLRPRDKRLQDKRGFGIRSRARIRGRLLVPLDRRYRDKLMSLQLGQLVGLGSMD